MIRFSQTDLELLKTKSTNKNPKKKYCSKLPWKSNSGNKVETHHLGVSKNSGTPKSSILIGFSIINHPFWGPTPIFGNIHFFSKFKSHHGEKFGPSRVPSSKGSAKKSRFAKIQKIFAEVHRIQCINTVDMYIYKKIRDIENYRYSYLWNV